MAVILESPATYDCRKILGKRSIAKVCSCKGTSDAMRHSRTIGAKLFAAFFAMGVLLVALGGYGYGVLSNAGDMVTGTYDGPLMAINYARAARRRFRADPASDASSAELAASLQDDAGRARSPSIDDLTSTFVEPSLGVGEAAPLDREPDELKVVARHMKGLVTQWKAEWPPQQATTRPIPRTRRTQRQDHGQVRHADRAQRRSQLRRAPSGGVGDPALQVVARLVHGDGASARDADHRGAGAAQRRASARLGAVAAAKPHRRPASSRRRFRRGAELQDETGILLNSMTVMQDSIRTMMEREKARAESAETRLAQAIETTREGDHPGRARRTRAARATAKSVKDFFPSSRRPR